MQLSSERNAQIRRCRSRFLEIGFYRSLRSLLAQRYRQPRPYGRMEPLLCVNSVLVGYYVREYQASRTIQPCMNISEYCFLHSAIHLRSHLSGRSDRTHRSVRRMGTAVCSQIDILRSQAGNGAICNPSRTPPGGHRRAAHAILPMCTTYKQQCGAHCRRCPSIPYGRKAAVAKTNSL